MTGESNTPSVPHFRPRPVIVENVNTGRVGRLIHELIVADEWKGTRCGINAYDPTGLGVGSVQLSVEPDDVSVTCPECLKWREIDGRVGR